MGNQLSSKYKRLANNTILVFVGNLGSKLITLLMLPFYTKWLSVADYGVTDIVTIYSGFIIGIVTCCITHSIFVFPKGEKKEKQKEFFSSGLYFSLISFLIVSVFFYLADMYFENSNNSEGAVQYIWAIYWMVVVIFVQEYMQQFCRSIGKIKIYAISGIVLTALIAGLAFLLIPKYGVNGYILAQILAFSIAATYTFVFSGAYSFLSRRSIKMKACKEMLRYSIPLIPNGIMWWLVSALNRPIIEQYFGMDAVGIFAVANKFPTVISLMFIVFIFSWQISVLEEFKKEGYQAFYNKMLRVIFLLLTLCSCGLAIFSEFIVSIMVDDKFIEAWRLIPILSIAVLFSSLSGFVGTNFSATRESKYFFYSSIWGAAASVMFSFILIPTLNVFGAALAVVLSHTVMAVARIKYSWKHVHITQPYVYVAMLLINILVIMVVFYIDELPVKVVSLLLLFVALMVVNINLLVDAKAGYHLLKNKFYKGKT
jgi:O-antigen/teichoic acid export membrane protein